VSRVAGVKTVYLGQFTWEHAEAIAKELEEAEITWWHKQSGSIMQFISRADWGVRLYVEKARLEDAQTIARRVLDGGEPPA
jgi:hypothetical protein